MSVGLLSFAAPAAAPPVDAPQFPNLLNGYAARPPAGTVAGVDFFVGCPSSVTLKSVATATLPAGVTRNTSTRVITIANNNTVMDGWNFNVGGGYRAFVTGDGCGFKRSVWGGAAPDQLPPILFQVPGGGTIGQSVDSCTIDAAGTDSGTWPGAISQDSHDINLSVTNTYILNAPSDAVSAGGGLTEMLNNLLYNTGTQEPLGAHADCLQNNIFGAATDPLWNIRNNTHYGPNFPIQGFIISNSTWGTSNVIGNVLIGPAGGAFLGAQTDCSGLLTIQDNYLDVQSGIFATLNSVTLAGGSAHCKFVTNINMNNGTAFSTNP